MEGLPRKGMSPGSMVQRGQFVTAYGQNVERSSVLKVSDAACSLTRSRAVVPGVDHPRTWNLGW